MTFAHDSLIHKITARVVVFGAAAVMLLVVCGLCPQAAAEDKPGEQIAPTGPTGGGMKGDQTSATQPSGSGKKGGQTSETQPSGSGKKGGQTSPLGAKGSGKTGGQFWRNEDGHSAAGTLWKMLASVVVILVLGAGAMLVTKKLLPRLRSAGGGRMSVTETVHLGAAATVHLVEVAGRQFMVGATREQVSMLAELSGPFPDIEDLAREMDQNDSAPAPEGDK